MQDNSDPSRRWTHKAYFRQYRLNVEQYGEILVAAAFEGQKMGDAQPCYDIEALDSTVRSVLASAGVSTATIDACLADHTGPTVRIEVKCKLATTLGGKATVIHCRNKLTGVRQHLAATHFAVVLFDGDGTGTPEEAWFFKAELADQLRRKDTKSGYIPVQAVRSAVSQGRAGILDIRNLIDSVASAPLTLASTGVAQQSVQVDVPGSRARCST